jgi:hypothetical protein
VASIRSLISASLQNLPDAREMHAHLTRDLSIAPTFGTEFEDFRAQFGFVGI